MGKRKGKGRGDKRTGRVRRKNVLAHESFVVRASRHCCVASRSNRISKPTKAPTVYSTGVSLLLCISCLFCSKRGATDNTESSKSKASLFSFRTKQECKLQLQQRQIPPTRNPFNEKDFESYNRSFQQICWISGSYIINYCQNEYIRL